MCETVKNCSSRCIHTFHKTDSVINVIDYRPVVRSLYDVKKPSGYLIPKKLKELTDWVKGMHCEN